MLPTVAARELGYEFKNLKGAEDQWEYIVGKKNRVSFTVDAKAEQITLVALGRHRQLDSGAGRGAIRRAGLRQRRRSGRRAA